MEEWEREREKERKKKKKNPKAFHLHGVLLNTARSGSIMYRGWRLPAETPRGRVNGVDCWTQTAASCGKEYSH